MTLIPPLPETEASEKVQQAYGRIKEMLGAELLPEVFLAMGRVEPFLRDAYMNLKKFVWTDGALDKKLKAAIGLASACHAGNEQWIKLLADRCRAVGWTEDELAEIIAVASTNYMYNTFFKFRDLSGSALFEGMGVGLRAHTFAGTSLDERTVELINTAISDINACRPCTSGHVEGARQLGISDEQLLETIQCAATVYAAAQFTNAANA
jgi:lipoyl-dependent peroxiredoxin subunit D